MADYRAIDAAAQSLVYLLRVAYDPDLFGQELQFQVYSRDNYRQPMSAGLSVFLYRIVTNGAARTPTGRLTGNGRRQLPQLPLDLHFLLTFWGKDPALQHRLAGWVLRQCEDTPVLPAGLLDAAAPGVFAEGETLELLPDELPNEDLFRLWEVLAPNRGYELCVPYVVRNIRIESQRDQVAPLPVQQRQFNLRQR